MEWGRGGAELGRGGVVGEAGAIFFTDAPGNERRSPGRYLPRSAPVRRDMSNADTHLALAERVPNLPRRDLRGAFLVYAI